MWEPRAPDGGSHVEPSAALIILGVRSSIYGVILCDEHPGDRVWLVLERSLNWEALLRCCSYCVRRNDLREME